MITFLRKYTLVTKKVKGTPRKVFLSMLKLGVVKGEPLTPGQRHGEAAAI